MGRRDDAAMSASPSRIRRHTVMAPAVGILAIDSRFSFNFTGGRRSGSLCGPRASSLSLWNSDSLDHATGLAVGPGSCNRAKTKVVRKTWGQTQA